MRQKRGRGPFWISPGVVAGAAQRQTKTQEISNRCCAVHHGAAVESPMVKESFAPYPQRDGFSCLTQRRGFLRGPSLLGPLERRFSFPLSFPAWEKKGDKTSPAGDGGFGSQRGRGPFWISPWGCGQNCPAIAEDRRNLKLLLCGALRRCGTIPVGRGNLALPPQRDGFSRLTQRRGSLRGPALLGPL